MSYCRYFLSLALVLHAVACATTAGTAQPVSVEIWRRGDDALTMRFTASVEEAFKTSGDFVLSRGEKPGSLIVHILNHVDWERVGERERIHYSIGLDNSDRQRLGMAEGSCWSDALSECSS